MRRRSFLAIAGAAAAFPRVAPAQQAVRVPKVAFVTQVVVADLNTAAGVTAFNNLAGPDAFLPCCTARNA